MKLNLKEVRVHGKDSFTVSDHDEIVKVCEDALAGINKEGMIWVIDNVSIWDLLANRKPGIKNGKFLGMGVLIAIAAEPGILALMPVEEADKKYRKED